MRLPRFILNPAVRPWILLWQLERRENQRLRRELQAWQDKLMTAKGMSPIYQPPPRVEPIERPVIGISDKRRRLAEQPRNGEPTAEDILAVREAQAR